MNKQEILNKVDHTLLAQTATWEDIKKICDDGIKYNVASVCIPPCYVENAKRYVEDKLKICTVIGFPNGYNTTNTKVYETIEAVEKGADEIDMVINISKAKDQDFDYIYNEIKQVKEAIKDHTLKVIIETCYLTAEEIKKVSLIVKEAKADFVKTSTGFGTGGATVENVKLIKEAVGNFDIKASGGIKTKEDFEKMVEAGATRIGTSNGKNLI